MFVIMVIYAHKWHMYFCKHQEAIITIRLLAIATIIIIVMITQIFGHCKFYSPAQLVPIFRFPCSCLEMGSCLVISSR